jgi:MinD-like ATPase involved in chromosome partitioning or flagellar assembly
VNSGQVIAVWSATGSVGRTSVAASLACELSKFGKSVLAIDADVYAPSLAQHFGFDQHYSGISAAIRLIDQERLTDEAFDQLLLEYQLGKHELKILAGLTMANRWPEIGFEKIRQLLDYAITRFDFVVVDVASSIETGVVDARLLSERNSTTIGALSCATKIVAITTADPIGLNRFVWAMHSLRELKLDQNVLTLVNRFAQSGRRQTSEVAGSLRQFAEVEIAGFVEEDAALFGRALTEGVPAIMVGRNSSAKQALSQFALGRLLELPATSRRRLAKLG